MQMNAKAYYYAAIKAEDMKTCRLCGGGNVSLYIISEQGKPDRVNPVCSDCDSEHVYDHDKNIQKVVTHCGAVSIKARERGRTVNDIVREYLRQIGGNGGRACTGEKKIAAGRKGAQARWARVRAAAIAEAAGVIAPEPVAEKQADS